jgi:saccharopine dehydrogenase-like NADP-dependent oxidoreductase
MKTIALLGAGKIGRMVAHFLGTCGDYSLRIADANGDAAKALLPGLKSATADALDFGNEAAIAKLLDGAFAVISCAPFFCNPLIARIAKQKNVHYLDLTEDVAVTKEVEALAKGANVAFIPQCGLAPGFITIVANHLIAGMERIDELKMRVGALPRYPSNRLKYNLTWSTEGLVNEYCHPCEALANGEFVTIPALENLERLTIDGVEYEAFNTSGGLGTFAETLKGRARNVNYKSVRYPGHNELMKFLLHDLKFIQDPPSLCKLFDRVLPGTEQDQIVIFVSASGDVNGRLLERTYATTIYHQEIAGKSWSGIQITTAAGICAVLDLLAQGKVATKGFVRQEDIAYDAFIQNRFGKYYG